jgi:hypothetical protein
MDFLDYFYYKVFKATARVKLRSAAAFDAIITICVLFFFNQMTISLWLEILNIIPFLWTSFLDVILTFMVEFFLICWYFNKSKIKSIYRKYICESSLQSRLGNLAATLYVILTIFIFLITGFVSSG